MSHQTPSREQISLAGLHPTIAAALAGPLAAMAQPPALRTYRPTCGPSWARIFRSLGDVAAYEAGYCAAVPGSRCEAEPGTPYWMGWEDGCIDADRAHSGAHDRGCDEGGEPVEAG